mgnify:CR=1 FL=1
MFSWLKPKLTDREAEQLAAELRELCEEYDREFPSARVASRYRVPIAVLCLFLMWIWGLVATIATSGRRTWRQRIRAVLEPLLLSRAGPSLLVWPFVRLITGEKYCREEQRRVLLRRIQHKRAALVAALDRG